MRDVKLYPLQEKMVNVCRDAFRRNKRIVLKAPTGTGKTIIATWMIKQAMNKNKRSLFICDRISLVNQTSSVFRAYRIPHGIFQADNPQYDPLQPVQIGSIQTLARRKQRSYDFIIIDECHAIFEAHQQILEFNPDAYFLGLSATPFAKGLGKHFDTCVEPVPMKDLIKQGYLCKFEIFGPAPIDLSKVRTVAGEYKEGDLADAADKPKLVADVVDTWLKLGNRKTICFCVNVAHGRHLEREFRKRGVSAKEINGYMRKDGEDGASQIIEGFRNNEFKVIISTNMLTKGFDVPDVECVQFATATKSPIKWIQSCGRGLRISEGKEICRIIDHGSNAERLGFPDDYEFLGLDDGRKKHRKTKKKDRPEQLPKACPSCDFIKPAGVYECPACGFRPKYLQEVETEDGKLEKLKRKARSEYTLSEKQSFLAQCNQYYRDKGSKQHYKGFYGAAIYAYKDKFGCKPSSRIKWNAFEPVGIEVFNFLTYRNIKYAKSQKRKTSTPTKCERCGSTMFKIKNSGPHRKLLCAKCSKYIKFVNKQQENELLNKGQIAWQQHLCDYID